MFFSNEIKMSSIIDFFVIVKRENVHEWIISTSVCDPFLKEWEMKFIVVEAY